MQNNAVLCVPLVYFNYICTFIRYFTLVLKKMSLTLTLKSDLKVIYVWTF